MQISNSKGVSYVGIMEKKMKKMGEDMTILRSRDANIRDHLQNENK